jgi:hypothetical protein
MVLVILNHAHCPGPCDPALTEVPADATGAIDWPLEAAVPDLLPPEDQRDFYADAHHAAIRAWWSGSS